ncbi:MAG TPA: hypothetical protein PLL89_05440, partial [bacterium]|nr:hypothetical protein [bacterium]
KIPAEEKESLNNKIAALRKAIDAKNESEIRSLMQEIEQASHRIAEILYKQTSTEQTTQQDVTNQQTTQPQGEPEQGDKKVVDADYREVDGNK